VIKLLFPTLNGGEEEGLNDAGIETFEGAVGDHVARECAQNTSDASVNGQVELHFSLEVQDISQLPCLEQLDGVLKSCEKYWEGDAKAVSFFKTGRKVLKKGKLQVLKISDYGTTGLTGEDADRGSNWYGLVRSKGACNKSGGSGGSFGIGKYAPFAASALRTVFYYTRAKENEAFQGISRLVTHFNAENLRTQATGYIGLYEMQEQEPRYLSVRDGNLIPRGFRRNEGEYGTDIYIPAYRDAVSWQANLTISVLNNFWPAICLGKILFKIGSSTVSKANVESCVEKYRGQRNFEAYRYFRAYRYGTKFSGTLEHVGRSELWLIEDSEKEPNPIAVARKNGMIIDAWGNFRSRKPISGFFMCHDGKGNKILRMMEPPRHDMWDPKRREDGAEIVGTIRKWIRECIKEFLPVDDAESFDIDGFSKFIPDMTDEEAGEETFDDENVADNKDGFEPAPTKPEKNITKTALPPRDKPAEEESETEEAEGAGEDEETGGRGGGRGEGGKGEGGGSGRGEGNGGEGERKEGKKAVSTRVLRLRYYYDEGVGCYNMIIRADEAFEGNIAFGAECDDGSVEPVKITRVLQDSRQCELDDGRKSFRASIESKAAARFQAYFEQNEKMCLRIV